ncbi:MAG: orotidine-5'-phosphate decarboxylase [Gammaproteobacteria bacterium]|nr:MAG: orotidine-5'-phosphate decarboxylase [Gammaproteobacteria bacterium]
MRANDPRIIVAMDFSTDKQAVQLAERLDPGQCKLKVGKELFVRCGPAIIETFQQQGFEIFLDLKFHDIPNTVAAACRAAADLGVWMMNVHASGGIRMIEAAADALANYQKKPYLIAVTVLTSMDEDDLEGIGISDTPEIQVDRLATLASQGGADGVVCSAKEAGRLRQAQGEGFLLVTPGIRPKSTAMDDQKRVMTPSDAISAGSDYLVIGRPITKAGNPKDVVSSINRDVARILV